MAQPRPKDLDGFLVHLSKPDTKFRQQLGVDLLAFLAEPSNSIVCQDIGLFVDGLLPWMQSSNYKVSSNGIEVLTYLIDRLGTDFRPYLQTVLPNVLDRLGDAKDTVREKAQLLILKLLERNVLTPQTLLEKLQPGFSHKNAKIREEVLRCLVNTLNEHGAQSLTISKFIPDIVNLLSDPTVTVRDTAFNTLVDLYKHVGEKLRIDLQRKNIVPQSKWPVLSSKFDEAASRGELLPSAVKSIEVSSDEIDRAMMSKPMVPVKKPNLGSAVKQRSITAQSSASVFSRIGSIRNSSASSSGAVDEDSFINAFEECPKIQIFAAREVTEHLKTIQDIISDGNKEWNKRVDALKKIRSLVIAGATNFEEFYVGVRNIEIALQGTLKDLRSQVVREACITISYLSQTLANKFDKTAEILLQPLINLIQNSAKVMATSGLITVKFIIQNTHSPRMITAITSNAQKSKSKDIRRACCELLELMLTQWPKHPLERHVASLQEALKSGIADADPEARVISRKAFKGFKEHFPDQAEALLQSLEPSYRRVLQGESMSTSSSHNNIAGGFKTPRQYGRSTAASTTDTARKGFRSNSAIDLQAAQRAKARAQYSALARTKIQSGTASLPRPRKSQDIVSPTPERIARTRSRNSQSQPTSRSGSPSSRLAYMYHRGGDHESPRPRRLSSGIPRSTQGSRDTSRETSPNRGASLSRYRRSNERPPMSPASRPVLAQKILQQSREAENALADVLNSSAPDHFRSSPRRNMRSIDNQSDESETSSVCSERSERSFDSFKRPCDDINQIIAMCASTNWQERKDGLLSLQYYLANEISLTEGELKHLTEIFTRMFMDSHTKGLSVFLDTLHEVIKLYKTGLDYWLYVLLQRVFLKIGTETLSSILSKLMATLELIRVSFPIKPLIANVYRFLIDATQTPNTRVKTVVMNFLTSLCNNPDAAQHISQTPAPQALRKIITYAQDTKSSETRHAAKTCIVALWNCNTPQVTMMLAEMPKDMQDLASNAVQNHMRKSSSNSEPGSPVVLGSPKLYSPVVSPLRDGIDQEEIYRSLRKTTAEIQNYSFETLGSKLDRDRDTTSQDSGISQMSLGNDVGKDINLIEERLDDLHLRSNFNIRSGPRSLPFPSVNGITETDSNGFRSLGEIKDSEHVIMNIIETCLIDVPTPKEDKRKLLIQLHEMIKSGQTEHVKKNFKYVQVMKEAEATAAAMIVCPFETVVSTLAPLIRTSPYPGLLGAIKMLTKLIEANPAEVTDDHLGKIMPGLIKGSDHQESPVRKSSIFCMVALYKAVGEERLSPFINHLAGSKVKLLRLYISRSEQTSSVPTSPKNNSS
nr:CLIP-associating protein 1 [Leptinotarsa decemlineata]